MNMVEVELDLSLEMIPGIGPRTKVKLNENSIKTQGITEVMGE